jgi:hypothetical protein
MRAQTPQGSAILRELDSLRSKGILEAYFGLPVRKRCGRTVSLALRQSPQSLRAAALPNAG